MGDCHAVRGGAHTGEQTLRGGARWPGGDGPTVLELCEAAFPLGALVVCGEGGLGAHHVVGARTPRADGGVPARRADGAVRAELIGIATNCRIVRSYSRSTYE